MNYCYKQRRGPGEMLYSHSLGVVGFSLFNFLCDDFPPSTAGGGLVGLGAGRGLFDPLGPDGAPVEDVVVLESFATEEIAEELSEVGVVGLVVEAESATVIEEETELGGESTTKDIGGGGHFLLHDPVVFLLLGSSFKTLPGELTTEEVH
jgi:hypothetical protein